MGDEGELVILPRILQHSKETREIPERCAVLIYASVNIMFHEILKKKLW